MMSCLCFVWILNWNPFMFGGQTLRPWQSMLLLSQELGYAFHTYALVGKVLQKVRSSWYHFDNAFLDHQILASCVGQFVDKSIVFPLTEHTLFFALQECHTAFDWQNVAYGLQIVHTALKCLLYHESPTFHWEYSIDMDQYKDNSTSCPRLQGMSPEDECLSA